MQSPLIHKPISFWYRMTPENIAFRRKRESKPSHSAQKTHRDWTPELVLDFNAVDNPIFPKTAKNAIIEARIKNYDLRINLKVRIKSRKITNNKEINPSKKITT